MRKSWWKILSVLLIAYSIVGGLLMPVPRMAIVNETIRNTFYHVPMWFSMTCMFAVSVVYSVRYLRSNNLKDDIFASSFVNAGVVFGILGMITGMEWAKFTWGDPWSNDPKQLTSALSLLIYFAYIVLRGSLPDWEKRARIGAVYNIFAFALMIPLIFVIPKFTDSLHPGNGGNPAFGDMDSLMRLVFYPAIIGWCLMGTWIATLHVRLSFVKNKSLLENDSISSDTSEVFAS